MKKIFTVLSAFFIALSIGLPVLGEEEGSSESAESNPPAEEVLQQETSLPLESENIAESPEPTQETVEEKEPAVEGESLEKTDIEENDSVTVSDDITGMEDINETENEFTDSDRLSPVILFSPAGPNASAGETGTAYNAGSTACFKSQLTGAAEGSDEIICLWKINGHPVYCIQPEANIKKEKDGVKSVYSGAVWNEQTPEVRQLCKRIAFFGYGHPMTGSDPIQYAATQMLIWKAIGYEKYQEICDSIVPTAYNHDIPCTKLPEKREELFQDMKNLESLVMNYDNVPSFAGTWHEIRSFSLEYQKELTLTDENHVLSWFQEPAQEEHNGIEITAADDTLHLKITDLYYAGHDQNGIVLTFRRNPEQWMQVENGLIMYTSTIASNQHVIAESGIDPVHSFQIRISLKTADLHIRKEDEYGRLDQSGKTGFLLSFSSEVSEGRLKNPLTDENGNPRIFYCDADGILRIDHLLPAGTEVFVQEYCTSDPLVLLKDVYSTVLPEQGTKEMTFTDPLSDASLMIRKTDEENASIPIDEAVFTVYETGNVPLVKSAWNAGMHEPAESDERITYEQIAAHSSLQKGDVFFINGKEYSILSSEKDRVTLAVSSLKRKTGKISRYDIPKDVKTGDHIETEVILKRHGTLSAWDDEKETHDFTVDQIISSEGNVLIVLHEKIGEPVEINSGTSPDIQRLKNALAEQEKQEKTGKIVDIGDASYEILSLNENSAALQPVLNETVSLLDSVPRYENLPHPYELKEGETFTLTYPSFDEEQNPVQKEASFTCLHSSKTGAELEHDNRHYEVEYPEWISPEDLPETISHQEEYRIVSIKQPAYLVDDSRGNTFYVAQDRTEVLRTASLQYGRDYAEMDGRYHDIGYAEITSACGEGIHSDGCPIGSGVEKEISYQHNEDYDGPLPNDLTQEQKNLRPEQGGFVYEDRHYDVIYNGDSLMQISYEKDGEQYQCYLYKFDNSASNAWTFRTLKVTFSVAGIKHPRTITLLSENDADDTFQLTRFEENLPVWSDITDHNAPVGRILKLNGESVWQVRENDKNTCMELETDGMRVAVYPDHTEDVTPVSWQEVVQLEKEAGKLFEEGDVLTLTRSHSPAEGDEFVLDQFSYHILDASDPEAVVLACMNTENRPAEVIRLKKNNEEGIRKIMTVYRPSSITLQEIKDACYGEHLAGDRITISNVSYFIQKIEKKEDGIHVSVQEEGSEKQYEILELKGSDPFSYQQYLETPKDLIPQASISINGKVHKVSEVNENHIVLKDENGIETEVRRDADLHDLDFMTFLKPYQLYDLQKLFHSSGTYELINESPHITLNGNKIQSDGHALARIAVKNNEGMILERKTFFFGTDPHEGTVDAIPAAHGISGHQYIRTYDAQDHNYPISDAEVVIYHDAEMQKEVCHKTSDFYGMIDISDLSEGKYYICENGNAVSFEVKSQKEASGTFSVSHLKEGREYMVCEEVLPEGYDYGKQQACTFVALDQKENEIRMTNRQRRLRLIVNKTDQDQSSIPLNGAWFSVTDLTYAEDTEENVSPELIISDLPADAETGDLFQVWRAKKNGRKFIWRIEECSHDCIQLSRLENGSFQGSYSVPVNGSSESAPMLYRDLVRSVHVPRKGVVFQTTEKEPYEELKNYRILSVTTRNAQDLFGKKTAQKKIDEAVAVDVNDPDHLIHIYEENRIPTLGASIGEFISGGIIVSETEKTDSIPLSWDEVTQQAGGEDHLQEEIELTGNVRHMASVPSYEEIKKVSQIGNTTISAGENEWKILENSSDSFKIETEGQLLEVENGMSSSAISWTSRDPLRIVKVWRNESGEITGINVESVKHNTWFIGKGQKPQSLLIGKPGVKVQILSAGNGSVVYEGVTGEDGRLVYTDVPDGDYIIVKDGKKEKVHCEKGMIFLPEIRYGHTIRLCETKSPLGYVIGDACTVVTPKAAYGTDTVSNYRTNAKVKKIITITRKKVKERKTGIEE